MSDDDGSRGVFGHCTEQPRKQRVVALSNPGGLVDAMENEGYKTVRC